MQEGKHPQACSSAGPASWKLPSEQHQGQPQYPTRDWQKEKQQQKPKSQCFERTKIIAPKPHLSLRQPH